MKIRSLLKPKNNQLQPPNLVRIEEKLYRKAGH
jgi:hypothetical protein